MAAPFIEQDLGTSADITSELATGSYTTTAAGIFACDFRISSMNGAAATITARLAHTTSGDVLIRNYYFSQAKHTAANTVFGGSFLDVPVVTSGDKLVLYLLSSNASDTSVSWQVDWINWAAAQSITVEGTQINQQGDGA